MVKKVKAKPAAKKPSKRAKAQAKNKKVVKKYVEQKVKPKVAKKGTVVTNEETGKRMVADGFGGYAPEDEVICVTFPTLAPEPKVQGPFVASPQQGALFSWVKERWGGNVFVEAVAGSGKSTSLREGCKFMTSFNGSQWHSVQIVAFNTKIVNEFQAKLDAAKARGEVFPNVRINTFHSIGWSAWRKANPDCKIDEDKDKKMLDHMDVVSRLRGIVAKLVGLAKNDAVCLDWSPIERQHWYEIIEHHDLERDIIDPEELDLAVDYAIKGIEWSKQVGGKTANFDDQIWLPVITPGIKFWTNNWVLVDEAQDTNPIRRHLAARICTPKYGRLVFVGDRHQAIYGFTGADADAVDLLKNEFKCKSLPLSVSYRCPQLVVKEAQKYVPHIQAHESAEQGIVRHVNRKDFMKVEVPALRPKLDAILCRNTRPLVSLAFQLIRQGIAAHVEGRSIGKGLIALLERWAISSVPRLRDKLEAYLEKETAKLTEAKKEAQLAALTDKVETLYVLMEGCKQVEEVVDKIERLFADDEDGTSNTVTLSTVHKAKGREWDTVFILGFNKYMPSPWARQHWQAVQENNLIYVAITRAMRQLVYTEALEEPRKL